MTAKASLAAIPLTNLFLALITIFSGVALWFGYSFATHATLMLDKHSDEITRLQVKDVELQGEINQIKGGG